MTDIPFASTPQTEAEFEAALAQIFAEIQRLNEQMRRDQADIDCLRAEATAYKAESQRLKAEGERLDADIRARLADLHTALDRLAGAA
jgi:peptidoglycan hydrolase CwlO-like protein